MNLELNPLDNFTAENVGADFVEERLLSAQKKSWAAIEEVARLVRPGWTEAQALAALKLAVKGLGYSKMWHPPQIRFGENTLKPYGKPSAPGVVLQENDLFFLDIGPLFDGYEGDAGKTFSVGANPEMQRLASDAEKVFHTVKAHWEKTQQTGSELYDFAIECANDLGWELSLHGASGHRVSEFPHALHHKGKLKQLSKKPAANRWILEIHLISKSLGRGAFFEDIL